MARSAMGDRPQSQLVAPAGGQSISPHRSAQVEAQVRIIAGLRAPWADLRVNQHDGVGQQRLLGSGSLRVPGPNGAP